MINKSPVSILIKNDLLIEKYESKILLLLLLVASFILYLIFFNNFLVPDSDFFGFHENVLAYLDLKLPSSFKRAPIYSLLIALFTSFFKTSILFAAEIISLIFALLNLYLLYRISSFFLGGVSIFVVLLFAINPTTLYLATQPLLETVFLTTILSTILMSLKGSNWCFLGASLSSLTRYEGAFLIPILVMKSFFIDKKRLEGIVLGLVSSVGIIVWMILSIRYSVAVNPYVEQWFEKGVGNPEFLKSCIKVIFGSVGPALFGKIPYIPLGILAMILFLLGLIHLIRFSYKSSLPIISFFFIYVLVHLVHPFNEPRFVFPVLWIFYLFIFIGAKDLVVYIRKLTLTKLTNLWPLKLLTIFGVVIFIFLGFKMLKLNFRMLKNGYLEQNELLLVVITYSLYSLAILLYFFSALRNKGPKYLLPIILTFTLSGIIGSSLLVTNKKMENDEVKYNLAQLRGSGEWYSKTAKPGDKLVSPSTHIMQYYSGLPINYYVDLSTFQSHTPIDFLSELRERNIKYIVWDGDSPKKDREIMKSGQQSTEVRYYYQKYRYDLLRYLFDPQLVPYIKLVKEIKMGPKTALIFEVKRN